MSIQSRKIEIIEVGFIPWLEKSQNRVFNLNNPFECAFATYLRELGFDRVYVNENHYTFDAMPYRGEHWHVQQLPDYIAQPILEIIKAHDCAVVRVKGKTLLNAINKAKVKEAKEVV